MGLLETQKVLTPTSLVFLFNDKDHEEVNRQMMVACKQIGVTHFVMPKFSKGEISKAFGVKRITCFGLDIKDDHQIQLKNLILEKFGEFNNNFETKPDLKKYRYADDSMFNQNKFGPTLIKKWHVELNPKKARIKRSKSAPK